MVYKFDLVTRVSNFGKMVLKFAKLIPKSTITLPLISQFVRAGTSVGANYCEADNSESRNDYKHKVGISKKEVKETLYWLEMIGEAEPKLKEDSMVVIQEAKELNLIFSAIVNKIVV